MTQPTFDIHPNSHDCGTFLVDVLGKYEPGRVSVRWSDQRRASTEQLNALIEQNWQKASEQAQQARQRLFDGPLCRLVNVSAEDGHLTLTVGKVSYKEFLGTNLTQAHLRYTHGPEVLANPLGVSAAVVTADGFLLLGRRSQSVAYHAGRIHPISGMVSPKSDDQAPDPFSAMIRELVEETNLPAESVREIVCLGIVRDKHIVQPEIIFDLSVDAEAELVRRLSLNARDASEHTELVCVRNHPAAVVSFLEHKFTELTPVCLATLLLHGLRHWGGGWFTSARGYLRSVL